MTTPLIGKLYQGPKAEIGTFENEKVNAVVTIKILNSKLYACLYQEWMGGAKEPYFESNFVGAYTMDSNLKLLGLGTMEPFLDTSSALLNIDFRHPFIDIAFPYLLIEKTTTSTNPTWEKFVIN